MTFIKSSCCHGLLLLATSTRPPPDMIRHPSFSTYTSPLQTLQASSSLASPSSTALAASPGQLVDYSGAAVQFFQSIRTPAALIAGSSLGNMFVMVGKVGEDHNAPSLTRGSKLRVAVLFLYHALSLGSMLLSLSTVATATCASNSLLTANYNPMATSAYEFLKREIMYEYCITQWSFYTAIVCFLKAVEVRALLEFNLLRKERTRSAIVVIFSITGLILHVLHVVNSSMLTDRDFWGMSISVLKLYLSRVWRSRTPMLMLSCLSTLIALGCFITLVPELSMFAKDSEGGGWIQPKAVATNMKASDNKNDKKKKID